LRTEIAQKVIAVEAEKFHSENFRKQGYQGAGFQPWKNRKDGDSSRAVLIETGRLRRAATRGRRMSQGVVFVLPKYGKVHNDGLRAGRGAGFKMPKRQFVGASPILKSRFKKKATAIINRRLSQI
ncbi:MAG: hypothetical protein AAFQ01_04215, partial [Bacteroidota bacterium]